MRQPLDKPGCQAFTLSFLFQVLIACELHF